MAVSRFAQQQCSDLWLARVLLLTFAIVSSSTLRSLAVVVVGEQHQDGEQLLKPWQTCDTFLAPTDMGWGVFAARSFRRTEVVEVAPLFVPLEANQTRHELVKQSIIDDYYFGYTRNQTYHMLVFFGMGLYHNHDANPNIYYNVLGWEDGAHALGFIALRDIQAGEQLFVTYGEGDGGAIWFQARGMEQQTKNEDMQSIDPHVLPYFKSHFCSKVYAGIGMPTWKHKILPTLKTTTTGYFIEAGRHFAPTFDAGLCNARAKVDIAAGEVVETATGLLLAAHHIKNTMLRPLAIHWDELNAKLQGTLVVLRNLGKLQVYDMKNLQRDDCLESYQDLHILPTGGTLALVRRVGTENESSNCRLVIPWNQPWHQEATGLLLQLIATRDITAGEVLKVDIKPPVRQRQDELNLLLEELVASHQPFEKEFLAAANDRDDDHDEL